MRTAPADRTLRFITALSARLICPKPKPDLSGTVRKCRIATAKFFTLLLLLYRTSAKVADIIAQGLDIHHRYHSQKERTEMVADILHKVGLAPEHANRYPHQFSGGQRQRVGIARALVMNPKLIIADECISALDMSIQAQVVNLMKDIQDETGLAYLFIAHDLSMVKYISDRIGVLHLGYLLETGTTEEIFSHPVHPYTRSLISAIPNPNPVVERSRIALHYDYKTSGLDYGAGTMHQIEGTHFVRGTDADLEKWV
ncbi:ABC transporter ATP-binding protein [Clostridium sp. AF02-29]|uniref:ABC transporter ATP-binding protein n=2 Tax=Clostridium sp. AF02-29 TaxID=2292993 RepID=UPI0030811DED